MDMENKNDIDEKRDKHIKGLIAFLCVYLFLYIFNYYTPMGFGDDYLYAFIWQGQPEFVPLTEDTVRVSSFYDIYVSQKSHYVSWGGRTVNHSIAQFFLWLGKDTFNLFNALAGTVLVAEIYWITHKGKVSLYFEPGTVWGIAFALWAFSPGFVTVFLWLEGACNYLWTATILAGFLIPYIHKYYYPEGTVKYDSAVSLVLFFTGVLAGWTNENSICWVILWLGVFLFGFRRSFTAEKWLYAGFAGLILGYSLLMTAPGNLVRLQSTYGMDWLSLSTVFSNFKTFIAVIAFQIFMWHFSFKTLYNLHWADVKDESCNKDILLAKVFGVMACGMSVIMLISPVFPLRSGFPGTVQLIISVGILWRIYHSCELNFISLKVKKIILRLSYMYFIITTIVAFNYLYKLHIETEELVSFVNQAKRNNHNAVLEIKPFIKSSRLEDLLSGFHLIENELTEEENSWENVAFSRYYGIKGIRVVQEKNARGNQ